MSMKPKINLLLHVGLLAIFCQTAFAQQINEKSPVDHSYQPLKLKMSEDGSKYVRFLFWGQMWASYNENNPGTLGIDGQPSTHTPDIGIRRARVLALAQVSPRFLIVSHFGINNQTFVNGGVPAGGATGNPGALPIAVNPETGQGTFNTLSAKKPQLFSTTSTPNSKSRTGFIQEWDSTTGMESQDLRATPRSILWPSMPRFSTGRLSN